MKKLLINRLIIISVCVFFIIIGNRISYANGIFSKIEVSTLMQNNTTTKGDYTFKYVLDVDGLELLIYYKSDKKPIMKFKKMYDIFASNKYVYCLENDENEDDHYPIKQINLKTKKINTVNFINLKDKNIRKLHTLIGNDLFLEVTDKATNKPYIYRANIVSKNASKLLENPIDIQFGKTRIFYKRIKTGMEFDLKSISLDGSIESLIEKSVLFYRFIDNKLYYVSKDERNAKYLYIMNEDGRNKTKMAKSLDCDVVMNITPKYVVCAEVSDGMSLYNYYKVDIKSGKFTQITQKEVDNMQFK